MRIDAIVVPRGAEAAAVERGWPRPRPLMLRVPAGALAGRATNDGRPIETALVLGVCGGIDPELQVGEAVVYREISADTRTIDLDRVLVAGCANALGKRTVRAAAVPHVIASAAQKRELWRATGAAAVDMEAASIADALHARGVRVAMVRVVSDDATTELPDLQHIYDASGTLDGITLAVALLRSPLRGARFVRNALSAIRELQRVAARLAA